MKEGYVLADEMWSIVDARTTQSSKNKFVSDILLRSRKRDLTYIFTAQLLDLLDKRVRKLLDFCTYPILNRQETVCKLVIFRSGYPNEGSYLKTVYYKTPLFFDCFDSILPDESVIYFNDENLHCEKVGKIVPENHKNIFVPTYDFNNKKMGIKQVRSFIEHYVDKDCYEIETQYGRKIRVTGDHSVLSWSKKYINPKYYKERGKIIPRFVRDLEIGNWLVIPKELPIIEKDVKEFDISELIKNFKFGDKNNFELLARIDKKIIEKNRVKILRLLREKCGLLAYKNFYNYRRKGYLPYVVAKELKILPNKFEITSRYLKTFLPNKIDVNKDLLWLLGMFVAEGCVTNNENLISIATEEKFLKKSKRIMENIFGNINICYREHTEKNGVCIRSGVINISNRAIALLFKKILSDYNWILQLPKNKLKWFLYGYWQGDGYHNGKYGKRFVSYSNNEKIANLILMTLSRFGVIASKHNYKYFYKTYKRWGRTYKNVKTNMYIISANGIKNMDMGKWDKIKNIQNINAKIIDNLVLVKIKKINKFNYRGYVYDFSVPKTQNFITGDLILAHNTNEEIDMEEEVKEDPQIVYQEDRNKKPVFFDTWEECDKFADMWWKGQYNKLMAYLL